MIGWKPCHIYCGCLNENACLEAPKNAPRQGGTPWLKGAMLIACDRAWRSAAMKLRFTKWCCAHERDTNDGALFRSWFLDQPEAQGVHNGP